MWKTLHYKLQKLAYHVKVLHKLEAEDNPAWQAMCYDFRETVENDKLMHRVLFIDEAAFPLL